MVYLEWYEKKRFLWTNFYQEYVKELNEILKKELVETDPGVQVLIEEQGNAEAEILDYHSVSRDRKSTRLNSSH